MHRSAFAIVQGSIIQRKSLHYCFLLDINECQENTHNCQQICQNTAGGFTCNCNTGYILDADSRTCNGECITSFPQPESLIHLLVLLEWVDINECGSRNGGCAHVCTNTVGTFTCSCRTGFMLTSDQRSCVGKVNVPPKNIEVLTFKCVFFFVFFCHLCLVVINQCAQANDNCDQFCMQNGVTVTCSCRTGYTLAENGRTCNGEDNWKKNKKTCWVILNSHI